MKLRKTKLTAIVMSALMAASTMSPLVYAEEDIILDEYATEAVVEGGEDTAAEAPVVEVEAVEEQAADTQELQSTPADGAYELVPDSIQFAYTVTKPSMDVSYVVKYVDVDGKEKTRTDHATATVKEGFPTKATCTEDGVIVLQVKILDVTYDSADYVVEKKLGHKYEEIKRQTLIYPTHYEGGLAHVWYKCARCGDEYDKDLVLEAQEHVWEDHVTYENFDNILLDDDGDPILTADGKLQLDDVTRDGYYDEVVYCVDAEAEEAAGFPAGEKDRETKLILAKKDVYAVITDQKGIADNLVGNVYYLPAEQLPLDNDSIELLDCEKDGSYVVSYFQNDDNPIAEQTIVVKAHHMVTNVTVEFKTKDDAAQCDVTYSEDGKTYKIYNKSCYLPVTYYEVTHCSAAHCKKDLCKTADELIAVNPTVGHDGLKVLVKKETVAEPNGDHIINTDTKAGIAQLVEEEATFEDLVEYAKDAERYVKVSNNTSTCTEDGTATVEYLCKVCKTVAQKEVVKVVAPGHDPLPPKVENYVAPTCDKTGSYDAITKCRRCGEVLREVRNVTVPRLKHTNEEWTDEYGTHDGDDTDDSLLAKAIYFDFVGDKVVDYDGESLKLEGDVAAWNYIGYHKDEFGVQVAAYTLCDTCGKHRVTLDKDVAITITDIQKQDSKGQNGYITLEATYTNDDGKEFKSGLYTFPYWSTMESYQGRIDKDPVLPLNGLHKDDDGVYRYYINDKVAKDVTAIVGFEGGEFLVVNGVLETKANGLVMPLNDGKWYMMSQGHVERQFTGVTTYNGEFFYVTNGELDTTVRGFVPYNGGKFLFWNGYLMREANGLWQNEKKLGGDDKWYFLSAGELQSNFTGVTVYDNAFFYLRAGVLAEDFNGVVTYNGAKFNVVAGMLTTEVTE